MIRPDPWRRITAAACFIVKSTPFRFTPMTLSQSERSTVSMRLAALDREPRRGRDAGVGEDDVEPSLGRDDVVDQRLNLALVRDVDDERARGRAALGELRRHRLDPLGVDVGERDVRAAVRQHLGHREAEPARRAGDDGARAADVEEPLLHARARSWDEDRPPGDLAFPELVEHVVHVLERMRLGAKRRSGRGRGSSRSSQRSIQLPTRFPATTVSPTTKPTDGCETVPP